MDRINQQAGRYFAALWAALRSDAAIYAFAAAYFAFGYLYVSSNGQLAWSMLSAYFKTWSINFGIIGPLFVTIIGMGHILVRLNERRGLAYRHMFAPKRVARFVAGTLLLLTAVLVFTVMFSSIKTTFPVSHGFLFDVTQANIDKAIHFGVDPWRLLYAVAEYPLVLRIVEANYNMVWFIICYFTLYWVCTSPRTETMRVRYVLTWMVSWTVIGTLIAGYWISAGPAYYGLVTGDTARFGDQLAFLATSANESSSAHVYQSYLWSLYTSGKVGIGSGISAFPSMHVAITVINALFVGEISRRWGIAMWLYVGLTVASSVYLGWHYAIDGYTSIVMVVAIYWAMRKASPVLARLRWKRAAAEAGPIIARNP